LIVTVSGSALARGSKRCNDGVGFAQQLLIDALQDELQLAGTDHHALGLRRDRQRNAERPAAIEALVEQAVAPIFKGVTVAPKAPRRRIC
jgi:hypothetical protein